MEANLPAIEDLTEVLAKNHTKIKTLLEQGILLKAGITEKNDAIREDHMKLNTVIENINSAVRLCSLHLQRHGAELAMEVSRELSFAAGNSQAHSGFIQYPNHIGVMSPVPILNPIFMPSRFPADGSFRTQEQNDAIVQAGLMTAQAQTQPAAEAMSMRKMLDEIAEFKKENPGSVWFKTVEKKDG